MIKILRISINSAQDSILQENPLLKQTSNFICKVTIQMII